MSRAGGQGKGTLEDPDMPVRTTIRRRMVSAMVDLAAAGHDRWYVVAHSLGSVLAFNALQELELALPNYLTEKHWTEVPDSLKTTSAYVPPDATPNIDEMMPRRPTWLSDDDAISREALFAKLRGFVTYGCPLDKFAALWPKIVPLNRQSAVFAEDAEWLNLYDATDPVAGCLDAFPALRRHQQADPKRIALKPKNIACRASPAFLLSHVRYFTPRRRKTGNARRKSPVPAAIFDAIADNASLSTAGNAIAVGAVGRWLRRLGAFLQVFAVAIILALAAAVLISVAAQLVGWKMTACPKITDIAREECRDLVWLRFQFVIGATGAAVIIAGIARMFFFDLITLIRS